MYPDSSVLMLEFNELCPTLMEGWIEDGRLPNFRRLHAESLVYQTQTEEQPQALEPWIQWVNVHSGLTFAEHGVFHLGEGGRLAAPRIWDVAARHGGRSWICGSMNTRAEDPSSTLLMPDPWAKDVDPSAPELIDYFRFVRGHVTEHTNDEAPLRPVDYARVARFMLGHGLSVATIAAAVRQLLSERGGRHRWKRAVVFERLQFDLFRWYYRRLRPQFATFFLNSTAHFQHMFWRHMEPDVFEHRPDAAELEEYGDAVAFGYRAMDQLVGRFLELITPGTTVIFCTALSQQPCLKYEAHGGKAFYRPRRFDAFLRVLHLEDAAVSPVMSEQFYLQFPTEARARVAAERLAALRVGQRPAMVVERRQTSVFTGCSLFEPLARDAELVSDDGERRTRFFDVFYRVEGVKSGMHHRAGMLWIRTPEHRHEIHPTPVALESIAPTVLAVLGIPAPPSMSRPPLSAVAPPVATGQEVVA